MPHPLDMAVYQPEPEPETWYERYAGWLLVIVLLMGFAVWGIGMWSIYSLVYG